MANANQNAIDFSLRSLLTAASYRLIEPPTALLYVITAVNCPNFGYSRTIDALYNIIISINPETQDERLVGMAGQDRLAEIARQILPEEKAPVHGEFYSFAKEHSLAVSGLAYFVADKLKDRPELSEQLRNHYEAHARGLLKKADDIQKVVMYVSESVTQGMAAERYAKASAFEKGLIEVRFPDIEKPEFEAHIKALSPGELLKIDAKLTYALLFKNAGFNISGMLM